MTILQKHPEQIMVTTLYVGGKIAKAEAEVIPPGKSVRPYWWWPLLGLVFAFVMMGRM